MVRSVIISSGDFDKRIVGGMDLREYEKISVDGGIRHFEEMGIIPDIMIGDFDSTDKLDEYLARGVRVERFPSKKDSTDTELAVDYALGIGSKEIIMLGSTGTRLDHTLGNLNILGRISQLGIRAKIVDSSNEISVISGRTRIERDSLYDYISLLPFGQGARGVTISGLKYEVKDRDFLVFENTGISNEFIDKSAIVEIASGSMLLIRSRDM